MVGRAQAGPAAPRTLSAYRMVPRTVLGPLLDVLVAVKQLEDRSRSTALQGRGGGGGGGGSAPAQPVPGAVRLGGMVKAGQRQQGEQGGCLPAQRVPLHVRQRPGRAVEGQRVGACRPGGRAGGRRVRLPALLTPLLPNCRLPAAGVLPAVGSRSRSRLAAEAEQRGGGMGRGRGGRSPPHSPSSVIWSPSLSKDTKGYRRPRMPRARPCSTPLRRNTISPCAEKAGASASPASKQRRTVGRDC
jgi:hypothetical protein